MSGVLAATSAALRSALIGSSCDTSTSAHVSASSNAVSWQPPDAADRSASSNNTCSCAAASSSAARCAALCGSHACPPPLPLPPLLPLLLPLLLPPPLPPPPAAPPPKTHMGIGGVWVFQGGDDSERPRHAVGRGLLQSKASTTAAVCTQTRHLYTMYTTHNQPAPLTPKPDCKCQHPH
eukprot:237733-Chlamydomonas_euryale.AAC.11